MITAKSQTPSQSPTSTPTPTPTPTPSPPTLYVNIVVLDHKAAVQRKVGTKIDQSSLPLPLKALAHQAALPKFAGEYLSSPTGTATQASSELAMKLPRQLAIKGLETRVAPVFQKGPYAVMQFQLDRVHVAHLLWNILHQAQKEEEAPGTPGRGPSDDDNDDDAEKAGSSSTIRTTTIPEFETQSLSDAWLACSDAARGVLSSRATHPRAAIRVLALRIALLVWFVLGAVLGERFRAYVETVVLPRVLIRRMPATMQSMIQAKMRTKRLVATGVVLPASEQAHFFYQQLAQMEPTDKAIPGNGVLGAASSTPAASAAPSSGETGIRVRAAARRRRVVHGLTPSNPLQRLSSSVPWPTKRRRCGPSESANKADPQASATPCDATMMTTPARRAE